jgi:DNA-binding IclR family transcriptional regulator
MLEQRLSENQILNISRVEQEYQRYVQFLQKKGFVKQDPDKKEEAST